MEQPLHLHAGDVSVRCLQTYPETDAQGSACHCHETYEFVYAVQGMGQYMIEGKDYTVKEGMLLVIPPAMHHYVKPVQGQPYERYVMQFPRSALLGISPRVLDSMEASAGGSAGCFFPPHAMVPLLMSVFDRFLCVEQLPQPIQGHYVRLLLSEIVLLLTPSTASRPPLDSKELGAGVLRYLNEHFESELSLDDIARRFFVSKYYLCRAFKKRNGVSVHTYVTQKRVLYAKRLIESGESASAAAYRVGFGDYSAFYRAYVKVTGASPTASVRAKEKHSKYE